MATHPTMNSMNRQKGITSEDEPLRPEGILYATWQSGGLLLIVPRRMKWLDPNRNDAHLWMYPMVIVV